jgi:hypothetical protein
VRYDTGATATCFGWMAKGLRPPSHPRYCCGRIKSSNNVLSVRECLETWVLQAQAGPVTVDALETILARATVPILHKVEALHPELVRHAAP